MKKIISGLVTLSLAAVLVIGLTYQPAASATVPGVSQIVSLNSSGGQTNNYSYRPSVSGNGQFVAFDSNATNLVSGDTNATTDAFVRDTINGTTTRVDVTSAGVQANGYGAWTHISYDGRYVEFLSNATNLSSGDTNGVEDIFVHDIQTGTTTMVDQTAGGVEANAAADSTASLSADGRYVVFSSHATNLVSGIAGTVTKPQVYIKDMQTGAIKALSVDSSGTQSNQGAGNPSISCDGNVVAFQSTSTNLTASTSGNSDIFVDSLGWSGDKIVDATPSANSYSQDAAVSCNGNAITFSTAATNLSSGAVNPSIYEYNRLTSAYTPISLDSAGNFSVGENAEPTISDDGRYVAWYSDARLESHDGNGTRDIYVRDTKNNTTQVVSTNPTSGAAVGWAEMPSLSADGSYVAYYDLAEGSSINGAPVLSDANGYPDIFISQTGF